MKFGKVIRLLFVDLVTEYIGVINVCRYTCMFSISLIFFLLEQVLGMYHSMSTKLFMRLKPIAALDILEILLCVNVCMIMYPPAVHVFVMFTVAYCIQGCFNGGTCTAPNTCTCVAGWNENNCATGMWAHAKQLVHVC